MLYLKILLALFLSAIPFVFKHLVLPKKDTSPSYRNLFSAVGSARPALKKWRRKSFNISISIYNAMKHSLEARKLFSFTLLLVLLTVVMVDFNASASVARKVMKIAHDNDSQVERLIGLYTVYSPYLTFRYATLLAGLMVIPFFSYRITDWILLKLSLNRRWFIAICSLTLLLLGLCAFHSSGRNIVIVQMLYIILGAAAIYPRYVQRTAHATLQETDGHLACPIDDTPAMLNQIMQSFLYT